MITKKELQNQINDLSEKIDDILKTQNENCDLYNKNYDLNNERWEMLKEYLGVKEEEYAKLKEDEIYLCGKRFVCSSEAIKKTRLVKIKNKK